MQIVFDPVLGRLRKRDISDGGDHTHNAAHIVSGVFDLDRLPHGALERLIIVENQAARFNLTTNDAQDGDTVKQDDTGVMYFIVDDSKLDNADGYVEYTAGTATAVAWSGVTDKPATFPPSSHTHTVDEVTNATKAPSTHESGVIAIFKEEDSQEIEGGPSLIPKFVAVPASSSSAGIKGQESANGNYYYKCTAANTWVRFAVETVF